MVSDTRGVDTGLFKLEHVRSRPLGVGHHVFAHAHGCDRRYSEHVVSDTLAIHAVHVWGGSGSLISAVSQSTRRTPSTSIV